MTTPAPFQWECPAVEPYEAPPGYYDVPFFYVFNWNQVAAALIPTGNAVNNLRVDLDGDSDFVLRRMAGFRTLMNGGAVPLTRFLIQVYDRDLRNYFNLPLDTAFPVGLDLPVVPEKTYPAGGAIRFDLPAGIDPVIHPAPVEGGQFLYGQVVFQGVRRYRGQKQTPQYRYREMPFSYRMPVTVNWNGFVWVGGVPTTPAAARQFYQQVNDYEFELLTINLIDQATGLYPAAAVGGPVMAVTLYGPSGRAVSNQPVVADYFFNNNTAGYYSQGLSPTLVYPAAGQIRVDVTSLLAGADLGPPAPQYDIVLNGVRRIPV